MSLAVIVITARMDLSDLAEIACCDHGEAAFVLLELLADGHAGADLAALDMDAIGDALRRACERMDALEIPA